MLRHAGPTPTHARLDQQADAVTIEVADAGPVAGHRPAADGGGHGLVGMRERAELLGGGMTAGHHGERGWLVQARLPRSPAT
ncbi:MAG: ATP-binding protein [Pseudonocardiaceae bacterium]